MWSEHELSVTVTEVHGSLSLYIYVTFRGLVPIHDVKHSGVKEFVGVIP